MVKGLLTYNLSGGKKRRLVTKTIVDDNTTVLD